MSEFKIEECQLFDNYYLVSSVVEFVKLMSVIACYAGGYIELPTPFFTEGEIWNDYITIDELSDPNMNYPEEDYQKILDRAFSYDSMFKVPTSYPSVIKVFEVDDGRLDETIYHCEVLSNVDLIAIKECMLDKVIIIHQLLKITN